MPRRARGQPRQDHPGQSWYDCRTLGRALHEKVISAAARRIIDAYGKDHTSLLSDDDVAIIVPGLTETDALAATEAAVALLSPIIEVEGIPFTIDPAGGVALAPQHGRNLDGLLIMAGLAADESRRQRRSGTLYVDETTALAERRITLLRELHTVLQDPSRHREITVLYQPQVEVPTGELIGVEALLRWTHPEWGPIPPDELIAAIEPSEVMHELTQHVLLTVVAQMQRWYNQGKGLRISVNASIQDLYQPNFRPGAREPAGPPQNPSRAAACRNNRDDAHRRHRADQRSRSSTCRARDGSLARRLRNRLRLAAATA